MSPKKKKIVCACLHVTEDELLEALRERKLKTLQDVSCYTAAGDGCTACHPALRQYLARYEAASPPPNC